MMRGIRTALVLVAGGFAIVLLAFHQPTAHPPGVTRSLQVPGFLYRLVAYQSAPAKATPEEVEATLAWADRESQKAVEQALHGLDPLFDRAKRNAPPFAERVLSWRAQWTFVSDMLGPDPGEAYRQFVRAAFEECFFGQDDLEREVGRIVGSFLKELRRIDEQVWQRIGMERPKLPLPEKAIIPEPRFAQRMLDEFSARAQDTTIRVVRDEIVRGAMATMLGEVLTQLTVRLGISAGIWGLGAATSPITYGGSFAAAWVVDSILAQVCDSWTDPGGSLSNVMSSRLEKLHRAILEGDDRVPGLRTACRRIAQARSQNRDASVHERHLPLSEPR